ncbi:hypothetical protein GCM10023222_45200 [Saccharopolyspora cebuensis]
MHRAEAQRRPALAPGPARAVPGVEHHLPDTEPPEVVRGAQAGLPGSDDDGVDVVHVRGNGAVRETFPGVVRITGFGAAADGHWRPAGLAPERVRRTTPRGRL